MSKSLIFLEHPEDGRILDSFLFPDGPTSEEKVIICLSFEAIELAERLGLKHAAPHQYIPSGRIEEEWTEASFELTERLCGFLDREFEVDWSHAFFRYFKILLDSCLQKQAHLLAILEKEKPDSVVYFSDRPEPPEDVFQTNTPFSEGESIYSILLPAILRRFRCESTAIPRPRKRPSLRDRLSLRLRPKLAAIRRLWSFEELGPTSLTNDKGPILALDDGYGLRLALETASKTRRVLLWDRPNSLSIPSRNWVDKALEIFRGVRELGIWKRRFTAGWERVRAHGAWEGFWKTADLDARALFEAKCGPVFTEAFPKLKVFEERCRRLLPPLAPGVVVTHSFTDPFIHVAVKAARRLGVPVAAYQHFAYGHYHWPMGRYVDELLADHKFVGGRGVVEYLRLRARDRFTPIPTGLISMDRLRGSLRPRTTPQSAGRRIVYAPSCDFKNNLYFSYYRRSCTEQFEIQRTILGALGKARDAQVIVKCYSAPEMLPIWGALTRWVKTQGWAHVQVTRTGILADHLKNADIVILDGLTTALFEAIASPAQVIVFNDIFRVEPAAKKLLEQRVVLEGDIDRFNRLIDRFCSGEDVAPGPDAGATFLKEYATFQEDGLSYSRIAAALESIVMDGKKA